MSGSDSAFPIQMPVDDRGNPQGATVYGLTKREYFAGLAMQGMCAYEGIQEQEYDSRENTFTTYRRLARKSTLAADALIEALEKGLEK